MCFQKSVVRIDVKINTDLLFEMLIQALSSKLNKFTHPPVSFVVFLAVADEDVVIISFDNA